MIQFEPAKNQLWLERGDAGRHWEKLQKRARDHPFNHAVEVFVPGVADLPADLCPPPPTYHTSRLSLSLFIEPQLCQSIPSWSLSALSMNTRVDTSNVCAVLPSGKLVLSVDKDTHEQLGLVGKPSQFQKQHRFLVEVDLTAAHFRPGKPNYDRVKWSLSERMGEDVDFVMCHSASATGTVTGETNLPEEVLHATSHSCVRDKQLVHNFLLPTLDSRHTRGAREGGLEVSCSAADLLSWLGALACGVDVSGEVPGDYVSTFQIPEPNTPCRYGTRTRWTGMVHSDWVCDLLLRARNVLKGVSGVGSAVPWIAVSVWGFEDSPVSWYPCEHGSHMWGDNHYTILLFPDSHYWTMTSLGPHDLMH